MPLKASVEYAIRQGELKRLESELVALEPGVPAKAKTPASPGAPEKGKPTAVSPAVSNITRHKIRINSLDAPIQKAIKKADSLDTAAVFVQLKELAISGELPFTGLIKGDALCYTDDNDQPATLTKKQLGKRLKNYNL